MDTWNCIGTNEDGEIVWFYTFYDSEEAEDFRDYAKSITSDLRWQTVRSDNMSLADAKQDLSDSYEDTVAKDALVQAIVSVLEKEEDER